MNSVASTINKESPRVSRGDSNKNVTVESNPAGKKAEAGGKDSDSGNRILAALKEEG